MKVILKDSDSKRAIMRNLSKLKNADEKFKRVSVTNDLTTSEREAHKEKLEEAKAKNLEEKGPFKFVVRGPPWNPRVARIGTKK